MCTCVGERERERERKSERQRKTETRTKKPGEIELVRHHSVVSWKYFSFEKQRI